MLVVSGSSMEKKAQLWLEKEGSSPPPKDKKHFCVVQVSSFKV